MHSSQHRLCMGPREWQISFGKTGSAGSCGHDRRECTQAATWGGTPAWDPVCRGQNAWAMVHLSTWQANCPH